MNRSKVIYFLLILSLTCFVATAQTSDVAKYTDFLPPPPNASSIIKYGEIAINKNTGAPNISIPLFTLKGTKLSAAMNLSYASTGIKVDEIASRVGLGWTLNIGGVVTRTVRGRPDGEPYVTRRGAPWAPIGTNWSTANFVQTIVAGTTYNGYDSEPDLFSFNFNGYSGSFILDDNGVVQQIAKSDIRIFYNFTGTGWNFRFLTPDGVSYYFGGTTATEKTKRTSTCGKAFDTYVANAWYLKQTTYPTGEAINYTYEAHNYSYETGTSQTMYYINPAPAYTCPSATTCAPRGPSTCINYVNTQGVLLKSISLPGKSQVNLFYRDRLDCGDSLVSKIQLVDLVNAKLSRSFQFTYAQVQANSGFEVGSSSTGDVSYAPFLTLLKEFSPDELLVKPYTFTYLDPSGRAARLSYAQDHWGYFNGASNSTLVPLPDESINGGGFVATVRFPSAAGNRNPDSNYVTKGMLSKITYPTGGMDTLNYEINTVYKSMNDNPYVNLPATVTGSGPHALNYTDTSFSLDKAGEVRLQITCTDNSGNGSFGGSNVGQVDILGAGGESFYHVLLNPGTTQLNATNIVAGTYTLRVSSNGTVVTTSVVLIYRPVNTTVFRNVPVGGVRVKSIISSGDGITPIIKQYYYGPLTSLHTSSMSALGTPNYLLDAFTEAPCSPSSYTRCATSYLYSTSANSLFDYQSGLVSYQTVVESKGENFAGGGIETTYHTQSDGPGEVIYNYEFLNGPKINYSNALNGKILEEKILKKLNETSLITIKKTSYTYKLDARGSSYVYGYTVNGRYGLNPDAMDFSGIDTTNNNASGFVGATPWVQMILQPVDIMRYKILSDWVYLEKLTEIDYDENGILPFSNITQYYHDNPSYTSVSRTESSDSKGNINATLFKYPYDTTGTAIYDSMLTRNRLDLIERKVSKNSTLLMTQKHNYGFFNITAIEMSSITSAKQTAVFSTDLKIDAYDALGNVLQYTGSDGLPIAFLWDYGNAQPIAKTSNATQGSIAATSFEADGNGNWNYNMSGPASSNTAITGNRSYPLTAGFVQKTALSPSSTYIISYWLKTGSGTVTVNSGISATSIIAKNGWTLYQVEITGTDHVQLSAGSGSPIIDELRLFPKNAQMTTFTYDPLVGITSQCDNNNRISYYQYDGLGRLQIVKDSDGNIIKTYKYNYKQ